MEEKIKGETNTKLNPTLAQWKKTEKGCRRTEHKIMERREEITNRRMRNQRTGAVTKEQSFLTGENLPATGLNFPALCRIALWPFNGSDHTNQSAPRARPAGTAAWNPA